jgi:hypothetical protein
MIPATDIEEGKLNMSFVMAQVWAEDTRRCSASRTTLTQAKAATPT